MNVPVATISGQFSASALQTVYFGPGSIAKLADELDRRNVRRALIVTGRSISANAEMMGKLHTALGSRIAGIFSDTPAHSPRSAVLALAEYARRIGADGLVSFGGGSASDSLKGAVLALAEDIRQPEQFDAFAGGFEPSGNFMFPGMTGKPLPCFAIPTTLSAGEFSGFVAMKNERQDRKDYFSDSKLTAQVVILDPELTLATPDRLWLSTGVKAIDHCVETLLAPNAQPYTDALASHALPMLHRNLKRCKEDGRDVEARGHCQIASWLSFCSANNVHMGYSHSIGAMLGGRFHVPHGETSCIMLHNVMDHSRPVSAERQAWIAQLLEVALPGDVTASAVAARDEILALIRALGLPSRLRDVNVPRAELPQVASALAQGYRGAVDAHREADILAILESAW